MEPNFETMTSAGFEKSNIIVWSSLMAGCVLISIILFWQIHSQELQSQKIYSLENFLHSKFMWISIIAAVGGYFIGNLLYQKKAEEGAKLSDLTEKVIAFRAGFLLKASLLEGPTIIAIIFMMVESNVYFLGIAAILLIAQFLNKPTNERFFYDFKVNLTQKQEFLGRGKV